MRKYADSIVVQLGVYGGVVLALHFSVVLYSVVFHVSTPGRALLGLPLAMGTAIFVPVVLWLILLGIRAFIKRIGGDPARVFPAIVLIGGCSIFVLLLLATAIDNMESLASIAVLPFGIFVSSSLFCNAYWAFGAYLAVAIKLARRNWRRLQFRLSHLMIAFTWLAAYLAAARASVVIALAEYAKLPTTPPSNCYIATAAARGHRRFVGSRSISLGMEKTMWVNQQLVTLKCGELAICALCPQLHRALRIVYDWLGPRLAACITHPLAADVVYVTLKPCEWAARFVLRRLMQVDDRGDGIYASIDTIGPTDRSRAATVARGNRPENANSLEGRQGGQ